MSRAKREHLSLTHDLDAEELVLVAAGQMRPPESRLPASFWSMPAPRVPIKRALAALLADREEAYLPLCVHQPATSPLSRLLKREGRLTVWWGTPAEIRSAFARLLRHRVVPPDGRRRALSRLAVIWCRERPRGRPFVCLDQQLTEAAERLGFTVISGAESWRLA